MAAHDRGKTGENYLLSGQWRSVLELAEIAEEVTGVKRPKIVSPMWLARGWAPFQMMIDRALKRPLLYTSESLEALRANRQISHHKAAQDLGYAPRPVEESVRDIYAWFDAAGRLSPPLNEGAP
jgi:dihydroflavonol-4-reductase